MRCWETHASWFPHVYSEDNGDITGLGLSLGSLKYKAQVKDEFPVFYLGDAFPGHWEWKRKWSRKKKGIM